MADIAVSIINAQETLGGFGVLDATAQPRTSSSYEQ